MSERDDSFREMVERWNRETRQQIELIEATDAKEIAELEARFGMTQQEAVVAIVEQTGWGRQTFPQYQGCPGSFQDELEALRSRWEDYMRIAGTPYDYEVMERQSDEMIKAEIEDWERVTRLCTHLVQTTDPKQVAVLERVFEITQENAVVHFVEQTEWGIETFPQYQDRRGTFEERLEALRAKQCEPRRLCRRPQLVRSRVYDKQDDEQIFP